MENKINIAELLKDCPSGLELNCTMYEDLYFDYVDELNNIRCYIQQKFNKTSVVFNQDGTPNSHTKSKCVIFPKDKTTWEGFVPPYKFNDGDVCYLKTKNFEHIFIFKVNEDYNHIQEYADLRDNHLYTGENPVCVVDDVKEIRLATEKEKKNLFDAIKENGYKWNPETKTLEKLPKFKIGNKIIKKNGLRVPFVITGLSDVYYWSSTENSIEVLRVADQDDWELVPEKFDIDPIKTGMMKEIHFYKDLKDCDLVNFVERDEYHVSYNSTKRAIKENEKLIHTTAISALDFSWLLDKGYKIYLHENGKAGEVYEGVTELTDKEIRKGHDIRKIWIGGGFEDYFYGKDL